MVLTLAGPPIAPAPDARTRPVPASGSASATAGRLRCLDVLRGLAVLGMILVNNQGSGRHPMWGLAHARWNGWSPADLVFPTFLFVVGGSLAAVTARRPVPLRRALRRTVLLFAIGLGLNALPPTPLAHIGWMGVLQRIGLTFLLAALVVRLPVRRQVQLAAAGLLGYWLLVLAGGSMTPEHSVPGAIDRALLGARHIYMGGGYDPHGIPSTIPATVSVLFGYWAVRWLRTQPLVPATARRLALAGVAVAATGQVWGLAFPINKRLWTSSYVLLAAGLAMVMLAACFLLCEVRQGGGRFGRAMEIFGLNALVVFAGSEALTALLKESGARGWLYDHVYSVVFGFRLGSLVYGLVLTALWWGVAWAMWRRRWFVKV